MPEGSRLENDLETEMKGQTPMALKKFANTFVSPPMTFRFRFFIESEGDFALPDSNLTVYI